MSAITIQRHGAVAVLAMNRPDQRNPLSSEMREAFEEAIPAVRDDPDIRAVVLTGSGGHFCAGGDVKRMSKPPEGDVKPSIFDPRDRMRRLHRWFDELVDLEKPLVVAVDGAAYGAGLSLAMAGDYVLASDRAKFCCAFTRMGYVPDMGAMYLLPRQIGLGRAKDLVFTGRVVGATEALQIGLIQKICDKNPVDEAVVLAGRLAAGPIEALGPVKSIMNRAFETERRMVFAQEAALQAMCRESAFHKEAVRRFMAKEPPQYEWKP